MTSFRKLPQASTAGTAIYSLSNHVVDHGPRTVPASIVSIEGRIATIKIEANSTLPLPLLTVPLVESEYLRTPLQPGCKGMLIGTHLNVDFLAGLNTQRPESHDRTGSLTSGVFVPISDKNWQELDGTFLNLYGVKGVKITDHLNGMSSITLDETSVTLQQGSTTKATLSGENITLSTGGATIILAGNQINITGDLTINGTAYKAHTHSNGNNGAPTGGVI